MALDFALSPDQDAIADAFGGFFANESPVEVVRAAEPLGFDPQLWSKLRDMEAPSMAAPESAGGGGADLGALAVVAETMGAALAPVPLIEHWVASIAHPVAEVVDGSHLAGLAVRPAVDGVWRLVPGGAVADWVVGVDGDELVAVASPPPMDAPANHASAPIADRSARDGERVVLGPASDHDMLLDRWRVLTASALIGVADRAMAIGVDYVMEREQFGRLVGSFQSVQHGLADLPPLIDGARFLVHKAAWAHDEGLTGGRGLIDMDEGNVTEFAPLAAMALVQAGEAAAVSSDRSLHYHGGYGFSLEYDIQLYFRRARGWANILGDPARERLRIADLLWGTTGGEG
ncbi:MAG: acyl-CoA dehydrogenase family protein [Acidimicrobiales bacterium]